MTAGTLSGSETDRSSGPLELSVVIVTYNEQDRISACIESVIAASCDLAEFEVILVDSNSTDRTVEIASAYPITILQIPDDELTTPGAGRYVGTQAARGELVLFVDGDMIVERDWLARALAIMQNEQDSAMQAEQESAMQAELGVAASGEQGVGPVAAIDGHLNEPAPSGSITTVDSVRGVALYRREILQSVSGFDPSLESLEDIHLGFELTVAGYRLLRLPAVAASHPSRSSVTEPIRRWRQGYMVGTGQAIRKSVHSPALLGRHLFRLRHRLGLLAWLCVGAATALTPLLFAFWLGLSVLASGVLVTKLGVRGGMRFLLGKLLGIVGLIRGVFVSPQPPAAFPLERVETCQLGPVQPSTSAVRSD